MARNLGPQLIADPELVGSLITVPMTSDVAEREKHQPRDTMFAALKRRPSVSSGTVQPLGNPGNPNDRRMLMIRFRPNFNNASRGVAAIVEAASSLA